jgi:lipoyl(octanoyl) transferase
MTYDIKLLDIGLIEYKKAWEFQEKIHALLKENRSKKVATNDAGSLIFCEHPHVYTLGKSGQSNNLLVNNDFLTRIDAHFYKSDRGGDITYHGPGQIVGYPIFDLLTMKLGVKEYINRIEEAIILLLKDFQIKTSRRKGATGVWLNSGLPDERKICAIGVRVSKAVTMHGFALNVNTDLNYFAHINPCGFQNKGVTSMQKELGLDLDINKVKNILKYKMQEVFGLRFIEEIS